MPCFSWELLSGHWPVWPCLVAYLEEPITGALFTRLLRVEMTLRLSRRLALHELQRRVEELSGRLRGLTWRYKICRGK